MHHAMNTIMDSARFLLGIVVSAAFVAMGVLMAVWPATYFRWVRWSRVECYAPWLVRRWDLDHTRWQAKVVGIGFVLFGITAAALWIFIWWFQ
jgi:hypothetical protein